jgi:ABC-type transport system involved in cytochrome bd biosynthesis fused ATPase/permease subunit
MTQGVDRSILRTVAERGAPSRRRLIRAVAAGAGAQIAGIVLVGAATALLCWSSQRPGLGAVAGILILVELVAFLRPPLRHTERVASHDLGLEGLAGWRRWLLDAVATWSPGRLAAARTGDLLTRCIDDTDRLQDYWVRADVPFRSTAVAIGVGAVALALLEVAAGAAILAAAALTLGLLRIVRERALRCAVDEAAHRGRAASISVELAHGAAALELLGAAGRLAAESDAAAAAAREARRTRERIIARLHIAVALLAGLVVIAAVSGRHAIGWGFAVGHPAGIAGVVVAALAATSLLDGWVQDLDASCDVFGAAVRLAGLEEPLPAGTATAIAGPLRLDSVDVAAAQDGPTLLRGVSLVVAPGASIALAGPSGEGKSSLLAIAARLEPVRAGSVTLAGLTLSSLEEDSLRRQVGWLPAVPSLLEGRIRDIVDLGRGFDDEAILAVLDHVGLASVLAPRGGLDAVVGSRGLGLSGGERRRLALARLLIARPGLLLLDEPTAGADEQTGAGVLAAIDATGAASLVATHDDDVVRWADVTCWVAEGRVS